MIYTTNMFKDNFSVKRHVLVSIVIFFVSIITSMIIHSKYNFLYSDIFLVLGLLLTVLILAFSIPSMSSGNDLRGLGMNNAQYLANTNFRTKEMEDNINEKKRKFNDSYTPIVYIIIDIIPGIILIVISFML